MTNSSLLDQFWAVASTSDCPAFMLVTKREFLLDVYHTIKKGSQMAHRRRRIDIELADSLGETLASWSRDGLCFDYPAYCTAVSTMIRKIFAWVFPERPKATMFAVPQRTLVFGDRQLEKDTYDEWDDDRRTVYQTGRTTLTTKALSRLWLMRSPRISSLSIPRQT